MIVDHENLDVVHQAGIVQPQRLHREIDAVAAIIWKMCDCTRNAEEVAGELSALYPGEEDAVGNDVRATIDQLLANGVLELSLETDA